jgi:predicted TIM-barrel fold metal-dependent hydrolase
MCGYIVMIQIKVFHSGGDLLMLISADSHVVEPPNLWLERLPAALRDRAPRATRLPENQHWYFTAPGLTRGVDLTLSASAGLSNAEVDAALAADPDAAVGALGGADPEQRLYDLWQDGTVADVIYPTAGLALLQLDDQELQEACFRVYNDWLAEFCAFDPVRLIGHALIPAWDTEVGAAEMERARALGLQGALIWTSPPENDSFFDRRYDRLWAAACALDMPVAIHTLAGQRESRGLASFGASVAESYYFSFRTRDEMQRSLCELIVAGTFERFSELRFIGAEGGINYAATMEMRLDSGYRGFWGKLDHGLTMKPSEYFRRNVLLTYITDEIGLNNLRFTGADHFMWSGDYPHGASTWPNSLASVRRETTVTGVSAADVERLTCTTAAELYHIDLDVVCRPSPRIAHRLA